MEEVWKDIVGYEGLYKVSNLGNVYSNITNKIINGGYTQDGYRYVALTKEGKRNNKFVHRLVTEAFIPNPDNMPVINHKDENPSNNNADNLEWCSYRYNATYNNAHIKRGEKMSYKVYTYNENGDLVKEYNSTYDLSNSLNMSNSNVSTACKNKNRTFCGMIVSYEELSKEEVLKRFKNIKLKDESIGDYAKRKLSKPVMQKDLNGNVICEYSSTREAGKQLNISPSLIASVCRGEHKQTHGFVFEYI